jgi:hypothetical protein
MDESANATATETASASSRARECLRGRGSEAMAAAYGSGLNPAPDRCPVAKLHLKPDGGAVARINSKLQAASGSAFVPGRPCSYATRSAIAVNWQLAASTVRTWNSSW